MRCALCRVWEDVWGGCMGGCGVGRMWCMGGCMGKSVKQVVDQDASCGVH